VPRIQWTNLPPALRDHLFRSPYTSSVSVSQNRGNAGLIWLDEDAAEQEIVARSTGGVITPDEAANLAKFSRDGYFTIQIELPRGDADAVDADVDRLWTERPANIVYGYDSPPKRLSVADPSHDRKPRYRIVDLQAVSEVALRLYLEPTLHRYASLILGETAVATQSLYFEFGSQQVLHRDSTVVPTKEFGHLVAAWIALEDIADEAGPLMYVPGSQRFRFYEFAPGRCLYDPTADSASDVEKAMAFYEKQLTESGLPTRRFLARRGEVLLWHSALMHGGAATVDEARTRKSLVVHYSTLASHRTRLGAVSEDKNDGFSESVYATDELLRRGGAFGLANPLDGRFLYRR